MTSRSLSWSDANTEATALGGWLASIGSGAENAAARSFMNGLIGAGSSFHIGFTDAATEGSFVWTNGQAVTYTNWNGGEPNNLNNEDVTEMPSSGLWNDLQDAPNVTRYRLVESAVATSTVLEPATMGLLGAGLVVLAGVARRRRRAAARPPASRPRAVRAGADPSAARISFPRGTHRGMFSAPAPSTSRRLLSAAPS